MVIQGALGDNGPYQKDQKLILSASQVRATVLRTEWVSHSTKPRDEQAIFFYIILTQPHSMSVDLFKHSAYSA